MASHAGLSDGSGLRFIGSRVRVYGFRVQRLADFRVQGFGS